MINADVQQNILDTVTAGVIAAAGNDYRSQTKTHEDYRLPDKQAFIEKISESAGWVQTFVTISANLGSKCTWKPAYKGEIVDNPIIESIVSSIKPIHGSQKSLRWRSLILQAKLGTQVASMIDTQNGVRYGAHHPDTIIKSRRNYGQSMAIMVEEDNYKTAIDVDANNLRQHIISNEKYLNTPYTPLCNITQEMLLYCCAMESIQATEEERKLVSTLIQFKPEQILDGAGLNTGDKPASSHIDSIVEGYTKLSVKAYKKAGPARTMPYPVAFSGDINIHKLGESVTSDDIKKLNDIISLAAIGLPIPPIWLMAGEGGSSNHWGDSEMRRALHQQRVEPELELNDEFWSEFAFRPLLSKRIKSQGDGMFSASNLDNWSLKSDTSCIEVKPDNANQLLEMYKCGVIPRNAVAESLGIDKLALPDDISEIEHLYNMTGRSLTEETPADPDARPEIPELTMQALSL